MPKIKPKIICDREKDDYLCKFDICKKIAQYGYSSICL
jgi:hypothetical protein